MPAPNERRGRLPLLATGGHVDRSLVAATPQAQPIAEFLGRLLIQVGILGLGLTSLELSTDDVGHAAFDPGGVGGIRHHPEATEVDPLLGNRQNRRSPDDSQPNSQVLVTTAQVELHYELPCASRIEPKLGLVCPLYRRYHGGTSFLGPVRQVAGRGKPRVVIP